MNAGKPKTEESIAGSQRDSNSFVEHCNEPEFTREQHDLLNEKWSAVEKFEAEFRQTGENIWRYLAEQTEAEYFSQQNDFLLQNQNDTMSDNTKIEKLKSERDEMKAKVSESPSSENIKKLGAIVDKINETEQKS